MPRELAGPVALLEIDVRHVPVREARALRLVERADDPGGDPERETAGRAHRPLCDPRARADEAAAPDDGAVQHDGADADEAVVLDARAVHDGAVPDRHPRADDAREAHVAVDHGPVLHVRVVADRDGVHVAAHDRAGPDARARAERDGAEDDRGFVDEGGGADGHWSTVYSQLPS